jgi:hypothetical protein
LNKGLWALVDDEDYEELSNYNWYANKNHKIIYAIRTCKKEDPTTMLMHRQIMRAKKDQIMDHINGNGLDNRKINLRFCTNAQNQFNSRIKNRFKTSKYKGICWHKDKHKWQAIIQIAGQKIHLGYFVNGREAAIAYNAAARVLFGEFARLNEIQFLGKGEVNHGRTKHFKK